MHYRTQIGNAAEEKVAQSLIQDGFTILERNYRKSNGEIDIIASKSDLMIFVEVKMRRHDYFDLSQVIVPSKQRKIIAVAKRYIAFKQKINYIYRFDVALLQGSDHNGKLIYIPNAFNEGNCTW